MASFGRTIPVPFIVLFALLAGISQTLLARANKQHFRGGSSVRTGHGGSHQSSRRLLQDEMENVEERRQRSGTRGEEILGQSFIGRDRQRLPSKWRSLEGEDTNVRLCSQAPNISPFVVGDYLTEEGQARLTVFDVEVLRATPAANGKSTIPTPPYLNILAFLESGKSINYSQWEYWGPAVFDRELARSLSLRCLFFRGGNPSVKALEAPVFQSDVSIVDENEHFLYFRCRLPLSTELLHASFLQTSHFQVQLVLQNGAAGILHMEPLPICRDDGNQMGDMGNIPGLQPYLPFNYSTSSKDSARQKASHTFDAPAKSNLSVSICIRPFHNHPFFLPKASTHSNLRLLEFVNHHLLLGVRQIYFYDRFGTEMEPLLEAHIERGLVVHMPFPQWSEVFYRRESFFGKAKFPYDFPQMYDQIIHIQACLMQGRRNRDDWMFIIDTDEFLREFAYRSAEQ